MRLLAICLLILFVLPACGPSEGPPPERPHDVVEPIPAVRPTFTGPTLEVLVDGIVCEENCTPKVRELFLGTPGVTAVWIDYPERTAHVELASQAQPGAVEAGLRASLKGTNWDVLTVSGP